MPRYSVRMVALAGAVAVLFAACGTDPDPTSDQADPPAGSGLHAVTVAPEATAIVVDGEHSGELAIATSQALYQHAPVIVLAAEDDLGALAGAAPVAVALGVPLLLTPPAGDEAPDDAAGEEVAPAGAGTARLRDELARLAPTTVLAFGAAPAGWAEQESAAATVVRAPVDPQDITALTGVALDGAEQVTAEALTSAIAALPRERPAHLVIEPPATPAATAPDPAATSPDFPQVSPAPPLDTVAVLARATPGSAAATATARASGARVLVLADPDPRTDPDAIAALAADPPTHVVALGDSFGPVEQLQVRVETAATGVELPGGGQVVYPGRRMVALYGHPGDTGLGALGEQSLGAAVNRARDVAASYEALVDEPVIPTFEIISTVASAAAGADGKYSSVTPVDRLRPWVDAARDAGVYVVLDLQPGHNDFLTQAKLYEELLVEPHVGLALDPEWRLAPGQRHMVQIGSVSAAEVNTVSDWLAALTRQHRLPQKLLIVHQFRLDMVSNRGNLDTGHDEVAVLIHADGFGTPGQKFDTWNTLRNGAPEGVWWGWKNFYDEDRPTFTPAQTVAVEPSPLFISYQ